MGQDELAEVGGLLDDQLDDSAGVLVLAERVEAGGAERFDFREGGAAVGEESLQHEAAELVRDQDGEVRLDLGGEFGQVGRRIELSLEPDASASSPWLSSDLSAARLSSSSLCSSMA